MLATLSGVLVRIVCERLALMRPAPWLQTVPGWEAATQAEALPALSAAVGCAGAAVVFFLAMRVLHVVQPGEALLIRLNPDPEETAT